MVFHWFISYSCITHQNRIWNQIDPLLRLTMMFSAFSIPFNKHTNNNNEIASMNVKPKRKKDNAIFLFRLISLRAFCDCVWNMRERGASGNNGNAEANIWIAILRWSGSLNTEILSSSTYTRYVNAGMLHANDEPREWERDRERVRESLTQIQLKRKGNHISNPWICASTDLNHLFSLFLSVFVVLWFKSSACKWCCCICYWYDFETADASLNFFGVYANMIGNSLILIWMIQDICGLSVNSCVFVISVLLNVSSS